MNPFYKLALWGALATLAACGTSPAAASSVAPDPILGELATVRLSVSSGDLGYEPIPGLDYISLESELEAECKKALAETNIAVAENAVSLVLVSIDHAWNGSDRSVVALSIQLQVRLDAPPVKSFGEVEPRKRSLAIWDNTYLRLAPADRAHQVLLEELNLLLERLADNINGARARKARKAV